MNQSTRTSILNHLATPILHFRGGILGLWAEPRGNKGLKIGVLLPES